MLNIEVRPISLKEYLPDRCMGSEPFDPNEVEKLQGCPSLSKVGNLGTNLESFYKQVLEKYGGCGFVAWHKGLVVGHITFFPNEVARRVRFWGWGERDLPIVRALVINCISVASNEKFRRIGVGTRLVTSTIEWVRENEWPRLEVHHVPSGEGLSSITWRHEQKGTKTFWEKFGFKVLRISNKEETLECCLKWIKAYYEKEFETEEEVAKWDPNWEVNWRKYSLLLEL
jgi:GNAT superfamily N-acetyltransferase